MTYYVTSLYWNRITGGSEILLEYIRVRPVLTLFSAKCMWRWDYLDYSRFFIKFFHTFEYTLPFSFLSLCTSVFSISDYTHIQKWLYVLYTNYYMPHLFRAGASATDIFIENDKASLELFIDDLLFVSMYNLLIIICSGNDPTMFQEAIWNILYQNINMN